VCVCVCVCMFHIIGFREVYFPFVTSLGFYSERKRVNTGLTQERKETSTGKMGEVKGLNFSCALLQKKG